MIELEETRNLEATRWARLAQVAARLGLVGVAIGWGSSVASVVDSAFLVQNFLPIHDRWSVVLSMLGGAGLALLVVLGALLVRGWRALPTLERLVVAIAPLAVVAFLPVLLKPTVWYTRPMPFLVMLALLVVLLERLLNAWLREFGPAMAALWGSPRFKLPAPVRRFFPIAVVVLCAAGYAAYSLYFSLQQHRRLATAAYDLGIYDNLMFNAMSGHPFRSPVLLGPEGPSYLVGHAEFAMLLFVPLYWLWPKAEMLLTLQAIALGFAAVPLYLFARTQLTRGAAAVLAVAYLFYAPMHGSSFYDFHWLPISMIFQFTLYFAIATQRNWLIAITYVLLILIREDIPVGLTGLGLFLLLSGIRPKLGITLAVCSAISFVAIKFGIMLWAGPFFFADLYYRQLVAPGEAGFSSVTRTLMTNPAYVLDTVLDPRKLNYFLHLMAPLAFLPLRRGLLIVLICAASLFTFLTTAYEPTVSISFQYSAHWIPYLFAAVVLMLGVLSRGVDGTIRRRSALGAIVFGVAVHSYVFGAVLQRETYVGGFFRVPFKITQEEQRIYAALKKISAKIPKTASVAATDSLVPHISNRFSAYTLRTHHGDADYLLLNKNALAPDVRNVLKAALTRNRYGFVTDRKSVV